MSTMNTIVHQPPSPPLATSIPTVIGTYSKVDGDGDQGIEAVGASGQQVNNNLSHAVHQALDHLHVQTKTTTADATGTPGKDMPPITMQGFIQALIASLHQIGVSALGQQSQAMENGARAVSAAASGRYAPVPATDVQSLIQQSATVLSSNTVLQQDFQSMLRAAGIDQSATSLHHFLHTVSSQMKPSTVVDAIA